MCRACQCLMCYPDEMSIFYVFLLIYLIIGYGFYIKFGLQYCCQYNKKLITVKVSYIFICRS